MFISPAYLEVITKSIDGDSRGKEFVIVSLEKTVVQYKSLETGAFYEENRKNFEKRMERVAEYWNKSNKAYKAKKNDLKYQ